jgi:5-methylcytosine-specific restriction endonuclease McrA
MKTYGSTELPERQILKCSIEGCERKHDSGGMCGVHRCRDYYRRNREKLLAQQKVYYGQNREQALASQKIYTTKNRDKIAARTKVWRETHPDAAKSKAWREAHPGAQAILAAAWYQANSEAVKARTREWKAANPQRRAELQNASQGRRRARKAGTQNGPVDLAQILERDGMVCHICTGVIESMADLHFDHVIPISKGGPHIAGNVRPSHALCNMKKGARLLT